MLKATKLKINNKNSIFFLQIIFAINYTLSYLEFMAEKRDLTGQNNNFFSSSGLVERYQCGDMNIDTVIVSRQKHATRAGFSLGYQIDKKAEQVHSLFSDCIFRLILSTNFDKISDLYSTDVHKM